MNTLSYRKGLAIPIEEMNAVGITKFEEFLYAFYSIFREAVVETFNYFLPLDEFTNDDWNNWKKHIQVKYGINARQATGVISNAKGQVDSGSYCRKNHIEQLKEKLKSAKSWVKEKEDLLKKGKKYVDYILADQANQKKDKPKKRKKKVPAKGLKLVMSIERKPSTSQELKFKIYHKKRYIYQLEKKIENLSNYNKKPLRVKVPHYYVFAVGSSDETLGNGICRWHGNTIKYRVAYCLEERFSTYVYATVENFDRGVNRLPENGSKSWHFFRKNGTRQS